MSGLFERYDDEWKLFLKPKTAVMTGKFTLRIQKYYKEQKDLVDYPCESHSY